MSRSPEAELEQILGHHFSNPSLLTTALTHSSYANDLRSKEIPCNERLEFLGDSVLNLITAEYLFTKFSHRAEGELTKARASIICEASCHEIAVEISLGQFLYLGRGEEQSGGRQRTSTLADALEAVVAALYLDAGLEEARRFLLPYIEKRVHCVMNELFFKDYKTALQEIVQKNKQETLRYVLTDETGPAHAKHFTVTLYLNSNPIATGQGHSKKEAEQNAAYAALELMGARPVRHTQTEGAAD